MSNHEPLQIDALPVRPGEKFGPCLLLLPPGEANFPDFAPWEIGVWAEGNWYVLDGFIVHPTHWAPLPDTPNPSRPLRSAWFAPFAIVLALVSNSALAGGGLAGAGPACWIR